MKLVVGLEHSTVPFPSMLSLEINAYVVCVFRLDLVFRLVLDS
jgi:hypothetical protein